MILNASANSELDLFVQPFIPKDLGGVNILKKILAREERFSGNDICYHIKNLLANCILGP